MPREVVPNPEKGAEIYKAINSLYKLKKEQLAFTYKLKSRIDSYGSGKNISKDDIISTILEDKYGRGYYAHVEAYKKQIKEDSKKVKKMLSMLKKEKK